MSQLIRKNILLAVLIGGSFIALMIVFALGLKNNPNELDLATRGQKIPVFSLPNLLSDELITNADLSTDKPYFLLNVWGSWCPSCQKEHAYLLALSQNETIYGVNWKDDRVKARAFIRQLGNPFQSVMVDDSSVLAIGLGVYGAPEIFLISADGTIVYRYAGPMDEEIWRTKFLPKIERLEQTL